MGGVNHVSQITNALLAAAGVSDAYAGPNHVGTNTGGVRGFRTPKPAPPAAQGGPRRKLLSTERIVERMRVSYPALRAARVDPAMK